MDDRLQLLESAYLARYNPDLEARVNAALDLICKDGEGGVRILIDHLFKDMTLTQSHLSVESKGELDHNEWLKREMLVRAVGRSGVVTAVRSLAPLLVASCIVSQFHEIFRPAVARALGDLGGAEARDALLSVQRSSSTDLKTTTAVLEALGHLEGSGAGGAASFIDISKREKTGRIGIVAFRSKASLLARILKPRALYQRMHAIQLTTDRAQRIRDLFAVLRAGCEPLRPYIYEDSFRKAWRKASGDLLLVVDFESQYPDFERRMQTQDYNGDWQLLTAYATHAIALGLSVQFLTEQADVVLSV